MTAPIPPKPPLVPRPPDARPERSPAVGSGRETGAGPQSLDGGRTGPPDPPAPATPSATPRAATMDTTWYGATSEQPAAPATPPAPDRDVPSAFDSPLVARYKASDEKQAAVGPPGTGRRPGKLALAAWIGGGVAVIAAVIVGLALFLGDGGAALGPAPEEAAAMVPSRLPGLSVELDRHPRALENVPFQRDAAGAVVTDPKRDGAGGYVAAVVLEPEAAGGDDFEASFEAGLRTDANVGEFSDTVFDAVGFRTAEVTGSPDVTRVWWYKPYRDAVVVVFASDEATGKRIIEGLVERNATSG